MKKLEQKFNGKFRNVGGGLNAGWCWCKGCGAHPLLFAALVAGTAVILANKPGTNSPASTGTK